MLRPASHDALTRLQRAAAGSDRELDRALSDVGVLPPLDLAEIRNVLNRPGCVLATCRNCDGHAIIEVRWSTHITALIHQDGRVQSTTIVAA